MRFKNSIQPFILFYGRALSPDFQAFLSQIALIISIKTILGIFVRPPQRTDTLKMMKRYRLWVVGYFQKEKEPRDATAQLSQREKEVLELLAKGFLYKEIGDKLNISTGTVRQHIHKIYEKLHVQNRTEAVNKFFGR